MRRVVVRLPKSIALDERNANNEGLLCPYEAGLAASCPRSSIVGRATARSPLLKRPLSGPVYFVQGIRFSKSGNRIRTLPTLLVALRGEIDLDLRARSSVHDDRLVASFDPVPDAAVADFRLSLRGGRKRGILVVTGEEEGERSLCDGPQRSTVGIRGHNGKLARQTVTMRTPCSKRPARPAKP